MTDEYVNGFIERRQGGTYEGSLSIDGVLLDGGIEATYFQQNGKMYLWIRRKAVLDYDAETETYKRRQRKPYFECYLEKQVDGNTVAYKGTFTFLHFRYSVSGIWDAVLGIDKKRMNLFVERLPMNQQTIINAINERNKNGEQK